MYLHTYKKTQCVSEIEHIQRQAYDQTGIILMIFWLLPPLDCFMKQNPSSFPKKALQLKFN